MKKVFSLLCLCVFLTACGGPSGLLDGSAERSVQEGSGSEVRSQEGPGPVSPEDNDKPPGPSRSGDASSAAASEPLSEEEVEAARRAALDYYAGTVFEVLDLTEIDPGEGEIAFRVSCAKGGAPQDPDRTITLERRGSVWTVTGEGY